MEEEVRRCDSCGCILQEDEGTIVGDDLCAMNAWKTRQSPVITADRLFTLRIALLMTTYGCVRIVSVTTTTDVKVVTESFMKTTPTGIMIFPIATTAMMKLI